MRESTVWRQRIRIALAGAVVLFFLHVFLSVSRTAGLDGQCKINLKMIALAVGFYAERNGGYLPPTLDALLDGNYFRYMEKAVAPEVLRCPVTGKEYIYFFEGQHVTQGEVVPGSLLVADRGFPHDNHKWTMTFEGAFLPKREEDVIQKLEEDPASLAELLKAAGTGRRPGQ